MPLFKYQPYYEYNGATLAEPFREELSEEEARFNIESFFDEIDMQFTEGEAETERHEDGIIGITADITQKECDERVKYCLNNLDLYANRIKVDD